MRSSSSGTATCRSTRRRRRNCSPFVRDEGKGFVAAHTGLTAFESWPEFGELLGGRYDGHPWHAPGHGDQRGADFPATKHFPPTFAINDEFYQAKAFSPNARVLLRLDVSKMPPHAELAQPGTFRWPGRRPTARAACSTRRSRMTPPRGTTATSR